MPSPLLLVATTVAVSVDTSEARGLTVPVGRGASLLCEALAKDMLMLSLLVHNLCNAGAQLLVLPPHDTQSLSGSMDRRRRRTSELRRRWGDVVEAARWAEAVASRAVWRRWR
ncbi:hypothetical protein GUJ93_ZPchr0010g8973 [Zizania palustris]|uniref:Secreted protein n=1 Tax=Zizania palustris TaxID=103762 RepID=A0A8J5WEL1_ZIZPA|nr:hypothetical protein GUJ93_ZPchr0010g8973 [Zizania palustris]